MVGEGWAKELNSYQGPQNMSTPDETDYLMDSPFTQLERNEEGLNRLNDDELNEWSRQKHAPMHGPLFVGGTTIRK